MVGGLVVVFGTSSSLSDSSLSLDDNKIMSVDFSALFSSSSVCFACTFLGRPPFCLFFRRFCPFFS